MNCSRSSTRCSDLHRPADHNRCAACAQARKPQRPWPPKAVRPDAPALCRSFEQLAIDDQFGDLHGVERGALAEIVGYDPEHQAVLHRGIFANTTDVGGILTGRLHRGYVTPRLMLIDDETAGSLAQDLARLFW